MEFTIEELPLRSRNRSMKFLLSLFIGIREFFKKQVLAPIQNHCANLTIKGEILVCGMMIGILMIAFIGRDIWLVQKQKRVSIELQEEMKQLSITQRGLYSEAMPVIEALQHRWIRENEGNVENLLYLLVSLSRNFDQELVIKNLEKYAQDGYFYLEGRAKNYETVFQLENLLQSYKWQSEIDLLSQNYPQNFRLKLIPLNRMVFE